MKKFCKRMLAVIVLYALVFTMLPTIGASAASVTKEQAVQWARSKIGKELYYDPGDMWCVDLIYYYYDYLGVPVYYGNAIDFATASAAVPAGSGWQRIPVTAGFVPQPGDIAVWKANYNWGSGWTYPEGHIGIVTCADTEGLMAVEMGHHRTPSENWFPLHAIQCVIRPNFVSSTPVSVITIQNANYPISKPNGNWFTVYGTVSSPNPLEWVQCYVTNTAGDWIFAAGWGFTPAEKAQTITTYDINALDSQMIFASLPAGTYIYHVDAYDKKGYFADIDQTFTVGNVAASSGVITQAGRHMHQNDFPGYSWGEWEVTKEATCTQSGIKSRKCYCGETQTETISIGGHSWWGWTPWTDLTGTAFLIRTRTCVNCFEVEIEQKEKEITNNGDLDMDGQITVADALMALRISAKIVMCTDEYLKIGDIDADGTITVADALAILRVAARIEDSF